MINAYFNKKNFFHFSTLVILTHLIIPSCQAGRHTDQLLETAQNSRERYEAHKEGCGNKYQYVPSNKFEGRCPYGSRFSWCMTDQRRQKEGVKEAEQAYNSYIAQKKERHKKERKDLANENRELKEKLENIQNIQKGSSLLSVLYSLQEDKKSHKESTVKLEEELESSKASCIKLETEKQELVSKTEKLKKERDSQDCLLADLRKKHAEEQEENKDTIYQIMKLIGFTMEETTDSSNNSVLSSCLKKLQEELDFIIE